MDMQPAICTSSESGMLNRRYGDLGGGLGEGGEQLHWEKKMEP